MKRPTPTTPAAAPRPFYWARRAFPLYVPPMVLALLTLAAGAMVAFVLSMAYRGLYGHWPAL